MSARRSGVHRAPQMTPAGSVGARKNSAKLATSVTITTEIALTTRRRMYSSTRGSSWRCISYLRGGPARLTDRTTAGPASGASGLDEHVHEVRHAHGRVAAAAADVLALDQGELVVVAGDRDVHAHDLLVQTGPLGLRLVGRQVRD